VKVSGGQIGKVCRSRFDAGYCLDLNIADYRGLGGKDGVTGSFIGILNVLVSSFQERGIFGMREQNSKNDTLDSYSGVMFVFGSKDDGEITLRDDVSYD